MIFRLVKTSLCLSVILLSGILIVHEQAQAESANVEIRAEGVGVSIPDTINGHYAMAMHHLPIKFIISAESDFLVTGAALGFRFYSPDGSLTIVTHGDTANNVKFPVWDNAFDLGGVGYSYVNWDGILPDTFLTGGGAISRGFGPTELVDIFAIKMIFPDDSSGVFCIDSTFVPPAGKWVFTDPPTAINPSWGASAGGYPDGGYCITIYEGCCVVPGDADHSGDVNISDALFIGTYIFRDGEAPLCLDDADADGGGDINIGDAVFLVKYIFQGGATPSCAP